MGGTVAPKKVLHRESMGGAAVQVGSPQNCLAKGREPLPLGADIPQAWLQQDNCVCTACLVVSG